jgi:hypothetical protein
VVSTIPCPVSACRFGASVTLAPGTLQFVWLLAGPAKAAVDAKMITQTFSCLTDSTLVCLKFSTAPLARTDCRQFVPVLDPI